MKNISIFLSEVFFFFFFLIVTEAVLTITHNLCFEQKYEEFKIFFI